MEGTTGVSDLIKDANPSDTSPLSVSAAPSRASTTTRRSSQELSVPLHMNTRSVSRRASTSSTSVLAGPHSRRNSSNSSRQPPVPYSVASEIPQHPAAKPSDQPPPSEQYLAATHPSMELQLGESFGSRRTSTSLEVQSQSATSLKRKASSLGDDQSESIVAAATPPAKQPKASGLSAVKSAETSATAPLKRPRGRPRLEKTPAKSPATLGRGLGRGRGRRRKIYMTAQTEAYQQRQAELKKNYHDLSEALKPVLIELLNRDIELLEKDPTAHTNSPYYEVVMRQLEERKNENMARIRQVHAIKEEWLKNRLASQEAIKETFSHTVQNLQDDYATCIKWSFMQAVRKLRQEEDREATDDEVQIVPEPEYLERPVEPEFLEKPVEPEFLERPAPPEQPSRSAFFLNTEAEWNKFTVQSHMDDVLPVWESAVAPSKAVSKDAGKSRIGQSDEASRSRQFEGLLEAAKLAMQTSHNGENGASIQSRDQALHLLAAASEKLGYLPPKPGIMSKKNVAKPHFKQHVIDLTSLSPSQANKSRPLLGFPGLAGASDAQSSHSPRRRTRKSTSYSVQKQTPLRSIYPKALQSIGRAPAGNSSASGQLRNGSSTHRLGRARSKIMPKPVIPAGPVSSTFVPYNPPTQVNTTPLEWHGTEYQGSLVSFEDPYRQASRRSSLYTGSRPAEPRLRNVAFMDETTGEHPTQTVTQSQTIPHSSGLPTDQTRTHQARTSYRPDHAAPPPSFQSHVWSIHRGGDLSAANAPPVNSGYPAYSPGAHASPTNDRFATVNEAYRHSS